MKLVPALFRSANVLEIARELLKRQQAKIFCGNSYVAELRPLFGGGANFNGWEGLAPQAALVLAPGISKHREGRVYAHNEHATFVQLSSATKWNVSNKRCVDRLPRQNTVQSIHGVQTYFKSVDYWEKRDLGPSIKLLTFTNWQYSGAEKPKLESARRV